MSGLAALLYIWSRIALVSLIVLAPIVFFSRRRVKWWWWELLGLAIPYWFWFLLESKGNRPKSLANLGELGNILVAVVILAVVRVVVARRPGALAVAVVGQAALVAVAGISYFLTPMLPE